MANLLASSGPFGRAPGRNRRAAVEASTFVESPRRRRFLSPSGAVSRRRLLSWFAARVLAFSAERRTVLKVRIDST
jgi:hypothetical protein